LGDTLICPSASNAQTLTTQGVEALRHAFRTADVAILNKALELLRRALDVTGPGYPGRHELLSHLGAALQLRFARTGVAGDLDQAIDLFEQALAANPASSPKRSEALSDLAYGLLLRLRHTGRVVDLDRFVEICEQALAAIPPDHRDRPSFLNNLGNALQLRFGRTGDAADLDRIVQVLDQRAAATPPDEPGRIEVLKKLKSALHARFERTGDSADLDRVVDVFERAVAATPSDNPNWLEVRFNFGNALFTRFERTGDAADLDRSVEVFEQVVAIMPTDHPERAAGLCNFGIVLHARFERTGDVRYLDRAIEFLEQTTATSTDHPEWAAGPSNLGIALLARFECTSQTIDLERAIDVSEQALGAIPCDHPRRPGLLSNLGGALRTRFEHTGRTADLDRAIEVHDEAITAAPVGHPNRPGFLSNLGDDLQARFVYAGDAADLDRGIDLLKQAVTAIPEDHPDRPKMLNNLGIALQLRFERFGASVDLHHAIEFLEQAITAMPADHSGRPRFLSNLGNALRVRFEFADHTADIDGAIDRLTQAVTATPAADADRPTRLSNLVAALLVRYLRTGSTADLDSAIDVCEDAVAAISADHPHRPRLLFNLAAALQTQSGGHGNTVDLDRELAVLREAAEITAGPLVVRAHAAWRWGRTAMEAHTWDQAVQGFGMAVELVGLAAPWELGRADQEFRLGEFAGLATEAAAACVRAGESARAVELFEQGRAILFSQILDSRSDLTDLRQAHPGLAERFIRCRDVLNGPGNPLGAAVTGDVMSWTSTDRLNADSRRAAAAEFDQVLCAIRSKPGFERFLAPRQLNELLTAAAHGPIVLLNIAALQSDALILTVDDVAVLPLPGVDPDGVIEQAKVFLGALAVVHDGNSSPAAHSAAAEALAQVLAWLADNITSPVLDHLGHSGTPPAGTPWPRVWWCPAGVLSLLPIHAAGHHRLSNENPDAVIDRVISSAIPNLGTLLHTRPPAIGLEPRLLVVAMPHTPGQSDLPGAADEAATLQQLWPGEVTVLGLPDAVAATHESVTTNLAAHPWVHFACHGQSELVNPSASHLLLADRPLTVIDLMHTHLSRAEMAFLSACTTARIGTKLPDEPIHLAAACQLAGYRHVIASLWPISDSETAWLAERFYTNLARGETGGPAAALHHATRQLRDTHRAYPHLWAPYIHSGP
jgi:tetratricopeptide (TPR) repeat protein